MFYDTLTEICKKKKVSPTALCLSVGMSKSNVTQWKNGHSPKVDTIILLAEKLGVNPMVLLRAAVKKEAPHA